MTTTVVEVGPQTVRGPDTVSPEWISVAIGCVDDQIAVLDGRLVQVHRLWTDLLEVAAGGNAQTLVLVVPTWWASSRIALVTEAAGRVASEVVVVQRTSILGAHGDATVVEFAEDLVVVAAPGAEIKVLPRGQCDVAGWVGQAVWAGQATEVLVDVPAEVSPPAFALTTKLRANGTAVTFSDRQRVTRSVGVWLTGRGLPVSSGDRRRSRRSVAAVLAGVLLSSAAIGGGWAAQVLSGQSPLDTPSLLVEGRVTVQVPSSWVVERITSGPGSARVRVSASAAESTALHITQSAGAASATIVEVAETLRHALESQRPGVFVDWNPAGSAAGRPAVTYREIRADSETGWAVVVDGEIRIAIGCQSPLGHADVINDVCMRAIRSAHVLR